MKPIALVLGLLCAALAFALYNQHGSAERRLDQLSQECTTSSNKISELTTRLALAAATRELERSNLFQLAERRTAELHNLSNRLVQTRLLLRTAQAEAREAQASLQTQAAQLALTDAQRDDLAAKLTVLPGLEKQLGDARRQTTLLQQARTSQSQELQRLQVEQAQLQAKLENVTFLRTQLAKAEDDAELRRRAARGRQPAAQDRRVRLEWQADGTVRTVVPSPLPPSAASQ